MCLRCSDYINLMTYDMAYGTQYFNSNLYDSTQWPTVATEDKYSAEFLVSNYLPAGLKPSANESEHWLVWTHTKTPS